MNARRMLAAGALVVAAGLSAGCAGEGPTLTEFDDGPEILPVAPPADTSGFIPPEVVP